MSMASANNGKKRKKKRTEVIFFIKQGNKTRNALQKKGYPRK